MNNMALILIQPKMFTSHYSMEVVFSYPSVSPRLIQRGSAFRNGACGLISREWLFNKSHSSVPRGKVIGGSEINILGMPAVLKTFLNFVFRKPRSIFITCAN